MPSIARRPRITGKGEGGLIVGRPLEGRVLIVDDVITAGTSVRESVEIIRRQGAQPAGVVIALDRQERGANGHSAVGEVRERLRIPVVSILTLEHLIAFLQDQGDGVERLERLRSYRADYGV
jgi:orotate phosphoribosyltransferase